MNPRAFTALPARGRARSGTISRALLRSRSSIAGDCACALAVLSLFAATLLTMRTALAEAWADRKPTTVVTNPRDAVILASIVEKETARSEERPLVAAVYRNRVRIGMGMQADPTVVYALQKAGRYDGNIRREDLAFDSPYNTYRYSGLPPGPIASPGRASLQAAASPANVDYIYFVSKNDGTHAFAATLDEHNRNVQEYQVKFFRAQRRGSGL